MPLPFVLDSHPYDSIFIRPMTDADTKPKTASAAA